MAERDHTKNGPGCPTCNPDGTREQVEVCNCLADGFAEGLRRWQAACSCCFIEAHPEGLEAAIASAVK